MKILKKDKNLKLIFIVTFIAGLINFYLVYTKHVMSFDALANGDIYKSGGWELDLGRGLLLVIDRLRFGLVSPPLIIFISLIYLSLSSYFLCKIFDLEDKKKIILITLIVVLFPSLSDSSTYIYCFDSYTLALLLSILSAYLLKKDTLKTNIVSIILIIMSLMLYQSYVATTITLVFLMGIHECINKKFDLLKFIKKLFLIFISLVIYYLFYSVFLLILGRSFASYKGADSFGINTFLNIFSSIKNAYLDFFSFLFNDEIIFNSFYKRDIINFILLLSSIYILIKNVKRENIIYFVLLLILLPISICILDLIAMDTRITLMTGSALFLIIVIPIIWGKRKITYVPVIILLFTYLLSNYFTFCERVDVYNNYYNNVNEILIEAKKLNGYSDTLPYMFNDIIRFDSKYYDMSNGFVSKQNMTFDSYLGIQNTSIFVSRFLKKDINIVDYETYKEILNKDEYRYMKEDSIKIIDNIIVVKLNDNYY